MVRGVNSSSRRPSITKRMYSLNDDMVEINGLSSVENTDVCRRQPSRKDLAKAQV